MNTFRMVCSLCKNPGHNVRTCPSAASSAAPVPALALARASRAPRVAVDPVTAAALRRRYYRLRQFELDEIADDQELGYKTRRSGLPDHISENIIKFVIIVHLDDPTCTWVQKPGDLRSEKQGDIECKSFTSDGPTSFGPTQKWDVIYFLDARDWLEDKLIVWKVDLPNTHEAWLNLKISKTQTKKDQADEARRPRINWEALYPQIKDHCVKVYEGTFEGIFNKGTSLPAISSTTGAETAFPASE